MFLRRKARTSDAPAKNRGPDRSGRKTLNDDKEAPDVPMQVLSVRKALKAFLQVVIGQQAPECLPP